MAPALEPNRIVLAGTVYGDLTPGAVVIVRHDGLEKIKRVTRVKNGRIYVEGDNRKSSRDSRDFGWLTKEAVVGKLIWPRV